MANIRIQNLVRRSLQVCIRGCGGLFDWITAAPKSAKRAGYLRWTARLVGALVAIWFFVLGPGNLLASVHPGFARQSADDIIVYFQSDVEPATVNQILIDAKATRDRDREFWGTPSGGLRTLSIYLCSSRSRWFQLGLCNDGNALTVGSSVLLYPKGINALYLKAIIGVELSHAFAAQHFGETGFWALPCWAEEGLATHLGAPQWSSAENLQMYLRQTPAPRLLNMSTLNRRVAWTNAYETNPPVALMYSHARSLVEYLLAHYGADQFKTYLQRASFIKNPNDVFASVYKMSLSDADHAWLDEGKSLHHFPPGVRLTSIPVTLFSYVKQMLPYLAIILCSLWLVRQMFRLSRFAGLALPLYFRESAA